MPSEAVPGELIPSICRFCGGFGVKGKKEHRGMMPFAELVLGMLSSQCQYCQIIVKATQKFQPDIWMQPKAAPGPKQRPYESFWLDVEKRGAVRITVPEHDGSKSNHVNHDFQIFYTHIEELPSVPLPKIPILGEIAQVAGEGSMWSFIERNLSNCLESHEKCRSHQQPGWFPKRLLRLVCSGNVLENVHLVHTGGLAREERYVALSHCWGGKVLVQTTRENLNRAMSQIPIADLPRTFQDCFTVARKLGVAYAWIDSLCIVQDDKADWAEHAGCMDQVYENALITVAATSSLNGSIPFLGPDAPSDRKMWQAIDVEHDDTPGLKVRKADITLFPSWVDGPLESRAWAFQERHLSTRTIMFTKEEVRWRCRTGQTCECLQVLLNPSEPEDIFSRSARNTDSMLGWRCMLDRYTRREVTYSTDRLPALSGVAARTFKSIPSTYLAGIWKIDIFRQLAWYRSTDPSCLSPAGIMWRSMNNGVPSWSWASIRGRSLCFLWPYDEPVDPLRSLVSVTPAVELISVNCEPQEGNMFGEVLPGSFIELRGRTVTAELTWDAHGRAWVRKRGSKPQIVVLDCQLVHKEDDGRKGWLAKFRNPRSPAGPRRAIPEDRLESESSASGRKMASVLCLLLYTAVNKVDDYEFGDILEEEACVLVLGKRDQKNDTYQRLGLGFHETSLSGTDFRKERSQDWELWPDLEKMEFWSRWTGWFANSKLRTVKIL